MHLGINGASDTINSFNKISMFKYLHNSGRFVNGKMLGAPGEVAVLYEMIVDRNTGEQIYAGKI